MQTNEAQETLQQKFIGKPCKVSTKNNRIFEGKLMGVDYKGNLILHQSIAEISSDQNCPLNYELQNAYDQKINYKPAQHLSEEQKVNKTREYMGTHYYFGAIMITSSDIAKIQMLLPPPSPVQNAQTSQPIEPANSEPKHQVVD